MINSILKLYLILLFILSACDPIKTEDDIINASNYLHQGQVVYIPNSLESMIVQEDGRVRFLEFRAGYEELPLNVGPLLKYDRLISACEDVVRHDILSVISKEHGSTVDFCILSTRNGVLYKFESGEIRLIETLDSNEFEYDRFKLSDITSNTLLANVNDLTQN